jgi:NADPH-dependent glutamate synthase beta subunit-like oxidoreductase
MKEIKDELSDYVYAVTGKDRNEPLEVDDKDVQDVLAGLAKNMANTISEICMNVQKTREKMALGKEYDLE